jgi:hypothetical protein
MALRWPIGLDDTPAVPWGPMVVGSCLEAGDSRFLTKALSPRLSRGEWQKLCCSI